MLRIKVLILLVWPGWLAYDAEDQTQGFVHGKQALYPQGKSLISFLNEELLLIPMFIKDTNTSINNSFFLTISLFRLCIPK